MSKTQNYQILHCATSFVRWKVPQCLKLWNSDLSRKSHMKSKKHITGDIKRFQKITFRSSATKNAKQNMTKADPKCCFFVKVNTRVHSEMIKVRVESTTIYSWMFLWVSSRTSTLSDSKNGLVITPDFQGSAYIDTILVTKMWMSQVLFMHIELKGWISPPGRILRTQVSWRN